MENTFPEKQSATPFFQKIFYFILGVLLNGLLFFTFLKIFSAYGAFLEMVLSFAGTLWAIEKTQPKKEVKFALTGALTLSIVIFLMLVFTLISIIFLARGITS